MRLQRIGRKNDPSYRVLVVDSRQGPKSGKYVDLLGSYNPKMDRVQVDGEKAKSWISKGVQVSPTVHNILVGQNIIEGKKVNVLPKKSPIVSEQPEEEAATTEGAEQPAEEAADEASTEEVKEETSAEEAPETEKAEEGAAEEKAGAEEVPAEAPEEEKKEDA